jgi:hypothetical protein
MAHPLDMQIPLDPAMRQAIFQVALYLIVVLGGTLAYVYEARYGRMGMASAVAAAAMLVATTLIHAPILLPVAGLGLVCTAMAARSISRERQERLQR